MASSADSGPAFFTKATPEQWSYVLSQYKEVLKEKASQRTSKKGGPEELIRLDTWYQEQLPKIIHSRKPPHIVHEELIQIVKWKLMRGKFRPRLTDLVRINTETAVLSISKKAFRKPPKELSQPITALTNLKGVGPATASAILAAAFPELVPYMADESMLSTPGIEATDYTLAEYLNYAQHIKACSARLNLSDPEACWTPHKVELTLWTHYLARDLKPEILDGMPPPQQPHQNGKVHKVCPEEIDSENTNDSQNVVSEENTNDSQDMEEITNHQDAEESTNLHLDVEEGTNDLHQDVEESTNDSHRDMEEGTNDSLRDVEDSNIDLLENAEEGMNHSQPTDSVEQPPSKRLCMEQY